MSLYVFKLWSEFGRLQVYSSLTLAKYKHYFWKLNETARWVHIHTKPSLKAEAFGVYDEWQTGKTFISDSLFSPLAAQLASANLQNPPFIGITDRISALVYLMQRLSALLCITSETVLWRFQCVFDPLLEAEWSFLFHNISRCFRTYHSAAIICRSPEGISFLLLSHFIEGQRSGSITQPVATMTPDDSVFCSVEVRKQEDLIVVEIHQSGLHQLITLPSIRPCSRVQEASHQGPFHSWRQFLMHLYSHAMPLCTP